MVQVLVQLGFRKGSFDSVGLKTQDLSDGALLLKMSYSDCSGVDSLVVVPFS
jgi:hypothetical protein